MPSENEDRKLPVEMSLREELRERLFRAPSADLCRGDVMVCEAMDIMLDWLASDRVIDAIATVYESRFDNTAIWTPAKRRDALRAAVAAISAKPKD